MTKQEEIFYILQDVRLGELTEYEATVKLKELGVVIKVDRELPQRTWYDDWGGDSGKAGYELALEDMAGYEVVEPLIGDIK